MRRLLPLLFLLLLPCVAAIGQTAEATDSTFFKGYYYNKEYDIYIRLDAYGQQVKVPGQSIFGELPGFLGDNKDGRKWLYTGAEWKGEMALVVEIMNDYGSEDLTATFELQRDGSFKLTQGRGATIKIARNRKWQKLPGTLLFVKQGSEYEKRMKGEQ